LLSLFDLDLFRFTALPYCFNKAFVAEKSLVERVVVFLLMPLLHSLFHKSLVRRPGGPDLAAQLAQHCLRIDFDRTCLTQVGGDTALALAPGINGHWQPCGIEMNVAHQFKQARIAVAQDRFETALKQVPDLAMAPVKSLCAAKLHPLDDLGERYAFRLQEQLDVVDIKQKA